MIQIFFTKDTQIKFLFPEEKSITKIHTEPISAKLPILLRNNVDINYTAKMQINTSINLSTILQIN